MIIPRRTGLSAVNGVWTAEEALAIGASTVDCSAAGISGGPDIGVNKTQRTKIDGDVADMFEFPQGAR